MLKNLKIPFGRINLIIERIVLDITNRRDLKFGVKQVKETHRRKPKLNVFHCQLDGKVDAVVMSTGTGGTLAGISLYLKEKNANIRTVLADPPVKSTFSFSFEIESFFREVFCLIL